VYAYSTAAAYQMGQELALEQDEVVLDRDITATDADISNAKVLSVRVAGNPVWSAK
jgi:hypothetical protein